MIHKYIEMKAELKGTPRSVALSNPGFFNKDQGSSLTGALKGCLGSLDGACIEELLLHCASALENNDVTLAQQVMWVLNNIASSSGDPNQRLTSWFLRALISRVSRIFPAASTFQGGSGLPRAPTTRPMTVTELAGYVDLIPWHRFGFCMSNGAILNAIQGHPRVHILDLSITNCMQWPTLIDALSQRPEGAPALRITVPYIRPPVPPLLNVPAKEVGQRLSNFAKLREVPFEFHVIEGPPPSSTCIIEDELSTGYHDLLLAQLNPLLLDLREGDALVVNCQNWLRYLPNEPRGGSQFSTYRDNFLDMIRGLNPNIFIVVDEDCDLDFPSLLSRIAACFNYLWIPFDALETFLPKDSPQRLVYEADVGHKIENIIGFEGIQRIERLESSPRVAQRLKKAQFISVPLCEETLMEVKSLLDEHASGWGMKREEDTLILTWKGHNSVFATAWVPDAAGFIVDDDQ